ncbi:MAG TPA: response regulator transcription factor [Gaiellaceae bacterium]|nr:response regulator transcription factor [Gaiellaceae bacterium]
MKVLLVEDNVELAETVARYLRRVGMAVDLTSDGKSALVNAAVYGYDVIVLDRDLPELHGDEVCKQLIARGNHGRVLMLTASGAIEDRVEGLNLGADDYLAKPFALAELVARVRALARRSQSLLPPLLTHVDLKLDTARRLASRGGQPLELSRNEFSTLEVLLSAQGAVVSSEELLRRVWDENADPATNTVKMTISRLRRKLGQPPLIETVAPGYRIWSGE